VVSIDVLDNSRILFEYDPLGHLTRLQYADGAALTYQYDELGRLMQAQSNDETLRYAYDERGYLSSLSGQAGTYAFSYDSLGGLSAINSPGLEITYERDLLGRVLVREAGDFGKTQYRYDSLGRLIRAELGEDWVDYAYNRNGWLDSLSRSNGVTSFYSYDSNGRPLNIIHAGPEGLIDQLAYTYDSVGNIARLNRQDWTILYSYDAAHQVISERWLDPNNQTRYTLNIRYDEAGNRAEMLLSEAGERSPNRTLYSYNRYNQLVAVIRNYVPTDDLADSPPPEKASEYRINYRYDERGNLIEVRHPEGTGIGWELAYDGQNRLLTIEGIAEDGQAINTRLSYDPLGRISEWQASEGAYRFYYEADTPALVGIENLTTGEQQAVLTGPGGEVLLSQGLQEVWYHHDLLNSTRRLTDESGALIGGGGYDYNAFGDLIQPYPAETPPLSAPGLFPLFAGQFYDPSTGLYLMGLRAYDPAAGRFIQRDPLRHDPQANLYTYAYNRPGVYIDPQGTSPQAALSASGAGLIPQHILPQAQVPPLLPELPTPPATHDLQAAENFRALALGQSLRWQWNETTSLLSPTLDSFYMYRLNPAPALAIQAAAMGGDSLLTTYQGGEAWGFLGAPSPLHNPAPQAWFGEVNLAFAGALSSRLDWCAAPMRGPYLALPTPPPGPPEVTFGQLGPLFAETPLYSSLQPQIQSLIPIPEFALRPPTQAATIFPPQALVNPVMLSEIEALQAQQRALYEQNFSLGGLPGGD
jgi:RHS repeat-associated protein